MDAPVPDKDLTGTRPLSTFVVSSVGRLSCCCERGSSAPHSARTAAKQPASSRTGISRIKLNVDVLA